MALPQQGTETTSYKNNQKVVKVVLMALPQQGTETGCNLYIRSTYLSVNGLTPTGDGNKTYKVHVYKKGGVNGLTPTGDGNQM